MGERLAIVLFNLGGPDGPAAVQPFLRNMFSDRHILTVPQPFRWMLAQLISYLRAPKSQALYDLIGGRSPLVAETRAQADALQGALGALQADARVFVFMRYWHPLAAETVAEIKAFAPDRVIVLPLYPQFSTTTTGTSMEAFCAEAARQGLTAPIDSVCCYPRDDGFAGAVAQMVRERLQSLSAAGLSRPRVIFTAHSLPEKIVAAGDPYQWQVEQTAALIAERIGGPDLDWSLSYQSRLGPLKWIGPSIEQEIRRAGADRVPVILAPIAFVSEHVETLVELDREMRELAHEVGVPSFHRIPAVRTHALYIESLARLAAAVRGRGLNCTPGGGRICPAVHGRCPHAAAGAETVRSAAA